MGETRHSRSGAIKALILLCAVAGTGISIGSSPSQKGAAPIKRRPTFISVSGTRLPTLFQGLRANPLYSIPVLLNHRRPPSSCSRTAVGATLLDRILGARVAYAQGGCENGGSCTGSYWEVVAVNCTNNPPACTKAIVESSAYNPGGGCYYCGFCSQPQCCPGQQTCACGVGYPGCNNGET